MSKRDADLNLYCIKFWYARTCEPFKLILDNKKRLNFRQQFHCTIAYAYTKQLTHIQQSSVRIIQVELFHQQVDRKLVLINERKKI